MFFINPGTEIKIDDINKINDTEARMAAISETTKVPIVKTGVILLITLVIGVLVFVITNYIVQPQRVVEKMIVKGRTVEYNDHTYCRYRSNPRPA